MVPCSTSRVALTVPASPRPGAVGCSRSSRDIQGHDSFSLRLRVPPGPHQPLAPRTGCWGEAAGAFRVAGEVSERHLHSGVRVRGSHKGWGGVLGSVAVGRYFRTGGKGPGLEPETGPDGRSCSLPYRDTDSLRDGAE